MENPESPMSVRKFNSVVLDTELRMDLAKNMFELAKILNRVGLCAPGISDTEKWYVIKHQKGHWVFYAGLCHLQRHTDLSTKFSNDFGFGFEHSHWPNNHPNGMYGEVIVYAYFLYISLWTTYDPFRNKPDPEKS